MYALIISGGEGARLRPHTDDRPKPMILVSGRPILEHQVRWLQSEGVTDVVFLCGYRSDVIERHFGDGSAFSVGIQYSREEEPLGRGGALRQGFGLVPPSEENIIALNGDILCNQPLAPLLAAHKRHAAVATLMLAPLTSPYGIVRVNRAGRVSSFEEKPRLPYWVNGGVYVLSRTFFSLLPERGDHETTVFPQLAQQGKLHGYRSQAYWRPIDTIKDLQEAERELESLGSGG
ncbi:MAG TPA: nucleotidyltransferase family protein [Dehalococcoidia bacterium]|nr:nucleotidyltransferase family protein [Dehalococcoidia bacterium]